MNFLLPIETAAILAGSGGKRKKRGNRSAANLSPSRSASVSQGSTFPGARDRASQDFSVTSLV